MAVLDDVTASPSPRRFLDDDKDAVAGVISDTGDGLIGGFITWGGGDISAASDAAAAAATIFLRRRFMRSHIAE